MLKFIGIAAPKLGATISRLMPCILLLGVFVAVVLWFDTVDFYHRHFFDRGIIVVVDNAARIAFVLLLAWLIYAPGAGIASILLSPAQRVKLTWAEHAVLGFGIGTGVWHVAMLMLGVLNLYYRPVMVGLALLTLLLSARHFTNVAYDVLQASIQRLASLRRRERIVETICAGLIAAALFWLLLTRGLYPGGGGDYYTHYFYYYLEVLKNHGLTPNDVWYHYYYSKGYGLFFFGMLLTDPEAPALVTFCCVAFASVAIATLAARVAPRSLWPLSGTLVFLLLYVGGFSHYGSEFQKDHELVSALMGLSVWAICMDVCVPARPFWIMSAASAVAASIVCQPAGILLALFTGLLSGWALLRRQWTDFWKYGFVTGTIGATVAGIFALSYFATGLTTDHELELSLYFANYAQLDAWGVIPQLVAILWLLDNLQAMAPPFGWDVVYQLALYMRLYALWPYLIGPLIALAVLAGARRSAYANTVNRDATTTVSFAGITAARLSVLIAMLAMISVGGGQIRSISFERFSTFFVPFLVLLGISASAWALGGQLDARSAKIGRIALPITLLIATMLSGLIVQHGGGAAYRATQHALQFATGRYSLAEAYTHTPGYSFGAINPGALAAAHQLSPNTPIWSTNLESFCMAPGCLIESVISFKMSGRLDEILGGDPELAKQRLQESGLNYFLFMKDARLRDLLPYSKLFAPDTIGRYLGIKWTDGSTFLLTWIGPETSPLGADFLAVYRMRLAEADEPWFLFSRLVPQIVQLSPQFRSQTTPILMNTLPWRHKPNGTIDIIFAAYGQNCAHFKPDPPAANGYLRGNATRLVQEICLGKPQCRFTIDIEHFGDPVPQCRKDFSAEYRCSPSGAKKTITVPAEASGNAVELECNRS